MPCYVRLPAGQSTVGDYALDLQRYFTEHEKVIMALLQNIVGFFTNDLWSTLPAGWASALSGLSTEDMVCLAHPQATLPPEASSWPPSLQRFLRDGKRLSLPRNPGGGQHDARTGNQHRAAVLSPSACHFMPPEADLSCQRAEAAPRHSTQRLLLRHIKPKKRHELQRLAQLIAAVAAPSQGGGSGISSNTVVDIGCGQGYLMRMLANMHGLDVVGVEAATENTDTASAKDARMRYELEKKQNALERAAAAVTRAEADATEPTGTVESPAADDGADRILEDRGSVRFLNRMVSSVSDVQELIKDISEAEHTPSAAAAAGSAVEQPSALESRGKADHGKGVALVGLHACGILTATLLRGYAAAAAAATAPRAVTSLHQPSALMTAATAAQCVVAVGCCYHKGGSDQSLGRAWCGQSARGDTKTLLLPTASDPAAVMSELPWDRATGATAEQLPEQLPDQEEVDMQPPAAAAAAVAAAAAEAAEGVVPGVVAAVDDENSSFPMSRFFAELLRDGPPPVRPVGPSAGGGDKGLATAEAAQEPAAACAADVGRWLGSSQVRELACHALEQYTARPWAHSPLLACAPTGIMAGMPLHSPACPDLAVLRASCEPEMGYLRTQCYRAVFEAELVGLWGLPPTSALGSVKRMAQLSYAEYAVAARKRLPNLAKRLGLPWPPASSTAAGSATDTDSSTREGERTSERWRDFLCFYSLRLCLAPLFESTILVDRLMYLTEQERLRVQASACSSQGAAAAAPESQPAIQEGRHDEHSREESPDAAAHHGVEEGDTVLLPLFDPYISPRNFVLISRRR